MTEYTLKPGLKKMMICLVFAILAFLLGFALTDSMIRIRPLLGHTIKWSLFMGSILLILLIPLVWLTKRLHITFNSDGIRYNDSRKGFGLVLWENIGEIQTSKFLFIPVVQIYHHNSEDLMMLIHDPRKKKNIEMIEMISSTILGINLLMYDINAEELKEIIDEIRT